MLLPVAQLALVYTKQDSDFKCTLGSNESLDTYFCFMSSWIVLTVWAYFVSWRIRSVNESDQVTTMLRAMEERATSAEFADAYYNSTGFAATLCWAGGISCLVFIYPFVWGVYYTDEYGIGDEPLSLACQVILALFAVATQSCLYGSLVQMWLLISLSQAELIAAFDELHPKIEQLGLHNYLTYFRSEHLTTTQDSVLKFNIRWNNGYENYRYVQAQLHPLLLLGLVASLGPTLSSLYLWMHRPYPAPSFWTRWVLIVFYTWTILSFVTMATALVYNTMKLHHLRSDGFRLVFSDNTTMLRVRSVLSNSDLTFYLAYVIPCTPLFMVPLILVLVSSACFLTF